MLVLQHVDNYEYEMPSDFEDEEIDEDLAFTAEDKKKYAGWFGEEPEEGEEEPEQQQTGRKRIRSEFADLESSEEDEAEDEDEVCRLLRLAAAPGSSDPAAADARLLFLVVVCCTCRQLYVQKLCVMPSKRQHAHMVCASLTPGQRHSRRALLCARPAVHRHQQVTADWVCFTVLLPRHLLQEVMFDEGEEEEEAAEQDDMQHQQQPQQGWVGSDDEQQQQQLGSSGDEGEQAAASEEEDEDEDNSEEEEEEEDLDDEQHR